VARLFAASISHPTPHRYDGAIKAAENWARKNPDLCTRKTQAQKRAAKKSKPF